MCVCVCVYILSNQKPTRTPRSSSYTLHYGSLEALKNMESLCEGFWANFSWILVKIIILIYAFMSNFLIYIYNYFFQVRMIGWRVSNFHHVAVLLMMRLWMKVLIFLFLLNIEEIPTTLIKYMKCHFYFTPYIFLNFVIWVRVALLSFLLLFHTLHIFKRLSHA